MDRNGTLQMRVKSWSGKPRKLVPDAKARPYDPSLLGKEIKSLGKSCKGL